MKEEYWKDFSIIRQHNLYGDQRKMWIMLKNRKKALNEEININKIKPELLKPIRTPTGEQQLKKRPYTKMKQNYILNFARMKI